MDEPTHEIVFVDPLSLGKINAIFGLVAGIIAGLLVLIGSSFISSYLQNQVGVNPQLIAQTQQFGFIGLILFLVLGIVSGFVLGAVCAFIYNIVVKLVGGIKIGIEEE